MENIVFFQFPRNIFAAYYQEQIILLDVSKNEYLSLSNEPAKYLSFIMQTKFKLENNIYTPIGSNAKINVSSYISQLSKNNIIERVFNESRNNHIATAAKPVGLSDVNWLPTKKTNNSKTTFIELLKIFLTLTKIHRVLKKRGLSGILNLLNSASSKKHKKTLLKNDMEIPYKLAYSIDKMCFIYPKKTWCLAWAATLTYLLVKHGYSCDFVIGVQSLPFYAHAWVEINKEVINDNPEIQTCLAPILRLTY